MAILKLSEPGDEATLNVTRCEAVEGNFGMQIKIDADNGDTLYVPQSSFDRQMDRMGIAEYGEAVGRALHFFRAPNHKQGGKPFWNIDKATPEDFQKKPANGKPATTGSPKVVPGGEMEGAFTPQKETGGPPEDQQGMSAFDALVIRYGECLDAVTELLNNRKSTVDPQAYAAMVATVFIARNQKSV